MIWPRCIFITIIFTCITLIYCKRSYKQGDVKLVGGNKKYMGTVLVRYNNRWGAICDEGWDKKDAHTVCNQLGFYAAASAPTGSKFGVGRKRMFLLRLGCTGRESSILECPLTAFSRFWRKRCPGEKRTAGVVCYPARRRGYRANRKSKRKTKKSKSNRRKPTPRSLERTRSRKIKKFKPTFASSLISTSVRTSTPSFKITSTLPSTSKSTTVSTHTTTSASSMMSSTSPLPSTSTSTSSSSTTSASISTSEWATLKSSISTSKPTTKITSAPSTSPASTSVSEQSRTSALTSSRTPNVKTTVSATEPTVSTPQSINVTQTTYSSNNNLTTEATTGFFNKSSDFNASEVTETILTVDSKKNMTLSPEEPSISLAMESDAGYNHYAAGVKSDSPDASVEFPVPFNMIAGDLIEKKESFSKLEQYDKNPKEALQADAPKKQKVDLELVGGRYGNEGYIRVKVNGGKWATVCSDHWTLREARAACSQLGGLGQAKQAVTVNYYGGQSENRDVYRIQCVGRESNLSACNLTMADDVHVCSKRRAVAGLICSKQLPDLVPNLKALEQSMRLEDKALYYLRCSMEENCLSSSAYEIRNTSRYWRSQYRRLMRFSTIVRNDGTADFRPFQQRSLWQWHACHMHYHSMEVFAHYDIMDDAGNRLAEGSKASFCLEDTACDNGISPRFNCRGYGEQGLSVNCSDNYMYSIDCQWIDVTDLKPGHYTFLMEINPDMFVAESNFDNNVVSCHLHYGAYNARFQDCHFQSLLDYRRPQKLPV